MNPDVGVSSGFGVCKMLNFFLHDGQGAVRQTILEHTACLFFISFSHRKCIFT